MESLMGINYWAIGVSVVLFQMLGALWWSPLLFGKAWMRALGLTKNDIETPEINMNQAYGVSFAVTVVSAFGLAILFAQLQIDQLLQGAIAGWLIWLAFNMTSRVKARMFDETPWTVVLITDGYEMVGYVLMGAIIGAW